MESLTKPDLIFTVQPHKTKGEKPNKTQHQKKLYRNHNMTYNPLNKIVGELVIGLIRELST